MVSCIDRDRMEMGLANRCKDALNDNLALIGMHIPDEYKIKNPTEAGLIVREALDAVYESFYNNGVVQINDRYDGKLIHDPGFAINKIDFASIKATINRRVEIILMNAHISARQKEYAEMQKDKFIRRYGEKTGTVISNSRHGK
ncbi:MAG: hypothetical protein FWG42_08750 [Clostridiales bacterium]|nr:hypothetical protein [Clostridiales bacterium]